MVSCYGLEGEGFRRGFGVWGSELMGWVGESPDPSGMPREHLEGLGSTGK